MDSVYHEALVSAGIAALQRHADTEGWHDVVVERDGDIVFVHMAVPPHPDDRYYVRIDASRYPVEPYEIGFLDPDIASEDRHRVSDSDPRYWPWSPLPGIHGSFHSCFHREIRVFWCRECTVPYFHYHGSEEGRQWRPAEWPLDVVVAELRQAITRADHPRHWRPVARQQLLIVAAQHEVVLPANAGVDHA